MRTPAREGSQRIAQLSHKAEKAAGSLPKGAVVYERVRCFQVADANSPRCIVIYSGANCERAWNGGGGGHMGGMGGGHMGGRVRMGGIGGLRGHPGVASHFFSRTGASRFGPHQNLAFRNHNFDRFAGRTNWFADRGRFGNQRFGREGRFEGREGRFEGREGERREREFFFRHNFFVGFDFGAFGWWPWWGWGGPWWWGWDGWGYPYPYGDYGYYPYYGDPQGDASQDNGSQTTLSTGTIWLCQFKASSPTKAIIPSKSTA